MESRCRAAALLLLLLQPGCLSAGNDAPPRAQEVQEAWTRFEKAWTPSLDPMRPPGDPVWKLQYEALILSMRSGKEPAPLADHAAVKQWAELAHSLLRDPSPEAAATRRALAEFDLARLDTARLGGAAPEFELTDLTGKTWRLSQMRGKKNVALIFLGHAG